MYDIREVDEHIKETVNIIQKLAEEINSAVGMLKKASGMKQSLLQIQTLENEADEAYFNGIGKLFKSSLDPITIIKMKELFEILENATDRCESVGNIIESIVLKHN
jgi:hypothetical protein